MAISPTLISLTLSLSLPLSFPLIFETLSLRESERERQTGVQLSLFPPFPFLALAFLCLRTLALPCCFSGHAE